MRVMQFSTGFLLGIIQAPDYYAIVHGKFHHYHSSLQLIKCKLIVTRGVWLRSLGYILYWGQLQYLGITTLGKHCGSLWENTA